MRAAYLTEHESAAELVVQTPASGELRTDGDSSPEKIPRRWSGVADRHVDMKHKKIHKRVRDVRTTKGERLE